MRKKVQTAFFAEVASSGISNLEAAKTVSVPFFRKRPGGDIHSFGWVGVLVLVFLFGEFQVADRQILHGFPAVARDTFFTEFFDAFQGVVECSFGLEAMAVGLREAFEIRFRRSGRIGLLGE
jgi:hypothetical protein